MPTHFPCTSFLRLLGSWPSEGLQESRPGRVWGRQGWRAAVGLGQGSWTGPRRLPHGEVAAVPRPLSLPRRGLRQRHLQELPGVFLLPWGGKSPPSREGL